MPSILTYTFVCLLIITSIVRIWLGRRHIAYVQHHRNDVPVAFNANIALEAHQKAADYAAVKTKLAMTESIVQILLLLTLTLAGGLQFIDDIWRHALPAQEIVRGALVICSVLLLSSLIDVP